MNKYLDKEKHKAGLWGEAIASIDNHVTLQGLSYAQKHENSTTPCWGFFMAMLPQEHDEVQIHHQPTVWRMIGKFQAACQLVVLLVTGSDFRPMESEK